MAEKKLEVKDLRISFRTTNGKVQAVRDIDFELYEGETLAIVGESGSGKSVTSRAIMGISAGNAVKEGGKILYDGKDLMNISEEEFHKIRGDKIAMVFQDPLSSLNPIMRIGQQLTEAMLLKNKATVRESKINMDLMFAALGEKMTQAGVPNANADLQKLKTFSLRHAKLQSEYSQSIDAAKEALALAENIALRIDRNAIDISLKNDITSFIKAAAGAKSRFVVNGDDVAVLDETVSVATSESKGKKTTKEEYANLRSAMDRAVEVLKKATEAGEPDTFSLGYYLENVEDKIPDLPVEELNKMTSERLSSEFMTNFLKEAQEGVEFSVKQTDEGRRAAIAALEAKLPIFEKESPIRAEAEAAAKELKDIVPKGLDPLEVTKDSLAHTFDTSIDYAIELYFDGFIKNEKEEKRVAKMQAKYDKLVEKGKTPDWEVIPASYINTDLAHQEMIETVTEMRDHFAEQIESHKTANFAEKTEEVIEFLKEQAHDSSYVITKSAAKERAIKLMESVGIDDARRRYRQYPFEFSGGMRQRIVIAIALTANPDILICDEPTTALDVTIQAQILDLINNLKKERNLSVIFITHDLGVVANMADRIAVMYAGKIVEYGTANEVFYEPAHPYTWALLSSVPDLDTKAKLESIPGTPPNMIYPPKGDAFADRNKNALAIDFEEQPPMFKITDTHYAATWLLHPNAPKLERPAVIQERIERMRLERERLGQTAETSEGGSN